MAQPHFLGTEASQNPLVLELTRLARGLDEAGFGEGAVSARYGPRVTINATGVPFRNLGDGEFVEVADYDPHLDRISCIGTQPPSEHAGLHQLLYRAKKEIMVVAQVKVGPDHVAHERLPKVEKGRSTLDDALAILEQLREHDAVTFDDRYVIAVGGTLPELELRAREALVDSA